MGRKRTRHHDLPPGLHRKRGRYYYGRRMEALGVDLSLALREWARRRGEEVTEATTFADAARHYRLHGLIKVAPSTQREYARQLTRLEATFGKMALEAIEPQHVHQYLQKSAPIAGTREKALLSIVFNHARQQGLTKVPNPCTGIRGTKSRSKALVSDTDLAAVLKEADAELATFLELCWRTGQDASVVLNFTPDALQADVLTIQRPKTKEFIHLQVSGLTELFRRTPFHSSLAALRKRLKAVQKRTDTSFTIKSLRAKAGTDSATSADLQAARRLLGHAEISTTAIYVRSSPRDTAVPVLRSLGSTSHRNR